LSIGATQAGNTHSSSGVLRGWALLCFTTGITLLPNFTFVSTFGQWSLKVCHYNTHLMARAFFFFFFDPRGGIGDVREWNGSAWICIWHEMKGGEAIVFLRGVGCRREVGGVPWWQK